jgi:hypothetical protein
MSAVTRMAKIVTGVVVVVAVLGVSAGVIAATSGGASAPSCEASVRRLAADITPSIVHRGLDPHIVHQSLESCQQPDPWRLSAERDHVATKLGAILNVPTLTTDSALNVLCLHFDPYGATETCKLRLAPGGAGLD